MTKLPEIQCRRCGNLKLPKQKCPRCFPPGAPALYTKLEGTKQILEERKRKKQQAKKVKKAKEVRDWRDRRKNARSIRYGRRLIVSRLALQKLLECFEQDRTGQWTIYEDKLAALQKAIKTGRFVLEATEPSFREYPAKLEKEANKDWEEIWAGDTSLEKTRLRNQTGI